MNDAIIAQELQRIWSVLNQTRETRPPPIMVDTAEAARLLGVSDTTLNVWVAAGKLPRFREGGVYRFRVADLDAFSKERTKVKNERRKQGKEETTVEP